METGIGNPVPDQNGIIIIDHYSENEEDAEKLFQRALSKQILSVINRVEKARVM